MGWLVLMVNFIFLRVALVKVFLVTCRDKFSRISINKIMHSVQEGK